MMNTESVLRSDHTGISSKARHPVLAAFIKEKAIIRGNNFRLASGRSSDFYIDGKCITFDGYGVSLVVDAIMKELEGLDVESVGGLDMGATPIASVVAYRSTQIGDPLSSFVVRKEVKSHGTQRSIEGPPLRPTSKVAVIDDVVTSGGSICKAIHAVQEVGCTVRVAISVVDRNAGAEALLAERHIRYQPLVTIAELGLNNEHAQ